MRAPRSLRLRRMSTEPESRDEIERGMRRLLREHDLPQPDDILDHEDGGIICLWHESKVAIIVDPTPAAMHCQRTPPEPGPMA
jgi:hypothetical protein